MQGVPTSFPAAALRDKRRSTHYSDAPCLRRRLKEVQALELGMADLNQGGTLRGLTDAATATENTAHIMDKKRGPTRKAG